MARTCSTGEENARRGGFFEYELDARLRLGEIEIGSGRAEAGRTRLRAVESEPRASGSSCSRARPPRPESRNPGPTGEAA